jgi:hypothetical protein
MKRVFAAALVLAACACAPSRVYLNRDVATALVLAPFNDSLDVDAPWKMWKYVEQEVASRGYRLVPHEQVWKFYEQKGFTGDPGQMAAYKTEELAKIFGVDAVVWSNITAWDRKTLVAYNSVDIKLVAEMYDAAGAEIWKGEGADGYVSLPDKRSMFSSTIGAAFGDVEGYAAGAADKCFAGLPWAGWDPKTPRDLAPEPPPPQVK